ncbi:hypothetical protein FHS19_001768 [Paenibacillus rhizosphaerae]|uniref:Uncharacterized protein n=1 Tax=Paenibacillus rhizosphaerae TaxID=297318 RepID=A0A839TK00_9BACL|nr:hypothetical protein [Paenibacillus rhizosphaerae]MBB3127114.1 hypothetical protein [Paenibacillus rhizosphaerae]
MTKQIQAYFKSEDDAESAKTKLIGFQTEHLEVSRLGDGIDSDRRILLPIAPVNLSGSVNAAGTSGAVGVPTAYPAAGIPVVDDRDPDELSEVERARRADEGDDLLSGAVDVSPNDEDYRNLEYVLAAKVPDDTYQDVVNILRASGGYVEIFD